MIVLIFLFFKQNPALLHQQKLFFGRANRTEVLCTKTKGFLFFFVSTWKGDQKKVGGITNIVILK